MTALATVTPARTAVTVNRRMLAAAAFIVFGLLDILVFGLFAHQGDATFALSLPGASVHVPSLHLPAARTALRARRHLDPARREPAPRSRNRPR